MFLKLKLISIFFVFYLLFNIYLLPHYGMNWDEPAHYQRGQVYLQYFLTGEGDKFSASSRKSIYKTFDFSDSDIIGTINFSYWSHNDHGHPPLNGILASLFNRIFYEKLGLLGDIESYHLFIVLVSVFLVFLVFYWAQKVYGMFAGIIAFLSIALYPLFFAESHFNIKDPVEAAFYAATLLFFCSGIIKNNWKYIIASSVFAGFALGMKFNILFAVFTILPWLVIYKWKCLHNVILNEVKDLDSSSRHGGTQNDKKHISKKVIIACAISPFIAFAILYATWPFLWQSPISNLLKIFSYYKEIGSTITYQPQSYLLFGKVNTFAIQWILYTTPLVILIFALIGVFYSLTVGFKEKNKIALFIFLWFLVPILRVSMSNTGIYSGVRQIMEYIPAIAILSGIGADYLVRIIHRFFVKTSLSSQIQNSKLKMQNYNSKFKILNYGLSFALCTLNFELRKKVLNKKTLQLLVILSFLPITLKLISIHPNENVYFNPLIGGLKGAKEKNLQYWGNTFGNVYRQGVDWLNENAEEGSQVARGVAYEDTIPAIWIREDIKYSHAYQSGFEKKGEYIIELTHDMPVWSYYYYFNYALNILKPVYEIKVDEVPILTIWKNDWEHTKEEYKKQEESIDASIIQKDKNYLLIDLGKDSLLTEVNIIFSNPNCYFTKDGYFVTQDNEGKWTNHPGDLDEITFYKNFNPRGNKKALSYLFPGIKTRLIKVIHSENNNCFENIEEVKIKKIP